MPKIAASAQSEFESAQKNPRGLRLRDSQVSDRPGHDKTGFGQRLTSPPQNPVRGSFELVRHRFS
jgi:hypothetical protein